MSFEGVRFCQNLPIYSSDVQYMQIKKITYSLKLSFLMRLGGLQITHQASDLHLILRYDLFNYCY